MKINVCIQNDSTTMTGYNIIIAVDKYNPHYTVAAEKLIKVKIS